MAQQWRQGQPGGSAVGEKLAVAVGVLQDTDYKQRLSALVCVAHTNGVEGDGVRKRARVCVCMYVCMYVCVCVCCNLKYTKNNNDSHGIACNEHDACANECLFKIGLRICM